MKVLVYGAGVIGCFLAHTLCQAGHEVTLLARGAWGKTLEEDGLVIWHSLQKTQTTDRPRIVDRPDTLTQYDAAFAVMQHQQLLCILGDLAQIDTPLLVLVGNNLSAGVMEREILARTARPKTVLFGFQGTGGRREDGEVICVRTGGGSMSLGRLHGGAPEAAKAAVQTLFAGTKYRLRWISDMDAWYRCHAAFILPVAYVCYATGCDLRKSTRRQRRLILDAANEACRLLKQLGCGIQPPGEDTWYRPGAKRALMAGMLFAMARSVLGDLAASDHCRHAVTEMEGLDAAWDEMRRARPDAAMPAWDTLREEMPDWGALHRLYETRTQAAGEE